jgi:SAM-dependent methyltransferase
LDILGINVSDQELKACKFSDDYFDLVSLLGVVEHLIDPLAELKEINRITKSDARLIITTLDIFAPVRFLRCFSYKPPEHMFYFSRKTLGKLLNKAGFWVENVSSYWRYYTLDDIVKRVEEFCLGDARFCSSCLEKAGLSKLIVRIPVNEMLVMARKIKESSVAYV